MRRPVKEKRERSTVVTKKVSEYRVVVNLLIKSLLSDYIYCTTRDNLDLQRLKKNVLVVCRSGEEEQQNNESKDEVTKVHRKYRSIINIFQ